MKRVLLGILVATFMFWAHIVLAQEPTLVEENRTVEDVVAAFAHLTDRGEWLGFRRSADAPANTAPAIGTTAGAHFQGFARSPRVGGSPILYVTRSGCRIATGEECVGPWKSDGTLLVVEMGSRDQDGERLRSNRLRLNKETQDTPPDSRDKVIKVINFDSGRLDYWHPGSMQIVGDILAVPLEGRNDDALPEGKIVFFNISQPEEPVLLDYELSFSHEVGVVGLTKLDDGAYFMVISWGRNPTAIRFYRSECETCADGHSITDPDFRFAYHTRVSGFSVAGTYIDADFPHQSFNFVEQEDGKQFLIGAENTCWSAPWHVCPGAGEDLLWLWEVHGFGHDQKGEANLEGKGAATKLLYSDGNLLGDVTFARQEANFKAAAGVYISPTGELLYYSTEYYFWSTDGKHTRCGWSEPGWECDDPSDNYLRFVELHHNQVSHRGTCGLQFPGELGGPYHIDEGDTLDLGLGIYYIEPWVHMFEDEDFIDKCHLSLPATQAYFCSSVMMDYADQGKDNYDDFKRLDGPGLLGDNGFNDQLTSFRWCGPENARLYIYDDDSFDPNGNAGYVRCTGLGHVVRDSNLDNSNVAQGCYHSEDNDAFNDEATSARILWDRPAMHVIQVDWGEGAPETSSIPWSERYFDLSHLYVDDDPSDTPSDVYTITVTAAEGGSSETGTTVTVHNVAPAPSIDRITDTTTGLEIGPGLPLPVALAWLEVNVAGSFTDPGVADTHTATIDLGDGTVHDLGAVVSSANASHVYVEPGDYTITLEVTDDDTGVGNATTGITVVDASGAMSLVLDVLRPLAADPNIAAAIAELEGGAGGADQNGAIDLLEKGNLNAALEKVQHAVQYLLLAEAADPTLDLRYVRDLLALAAKSVAIDAVIQAGALATRSNELRKTEAARVLVVEGDALLVALDHVAAVDTHQQAVREVLGIRH